MDTSSDLSVLGGLLVGGASRRMGTAKQLLVYRGETLAERAAAALAEHCDEVLLLGAGEVPDPLAGLERLADVALPEELLGERRPAAPGPLAGMLAAGRHRPRSVWVFAPCDLPRISGEAVAWLLAERRPDRGAVLVRPRAPNPIDPIFALYEPAAFRLLEGLAAAGERAPRAVEGLPGVAVAVPPEALAPCWQGVNTAAELAALR